MVFCFVQIFRTTQEFILSRKVRIFFPEFNIRVYDKNSESDFFFFTSTKFRIFFQQHWESEYFFLEKTITPPPPPPPPPFKLNGRSLMSFDSPFVRLFGVR